MKTSTTTEPTAAETCAARRKDIDRLLGMLQEVLDAHAAKGETHWSHAGDLYRVRSGLLNLVATLGGLDLEDVECLLANAE